MVRLSDLGQVKKDHQPIWGEAVINDGPGLMLIIQKFRGANTMEVTNGIEDAVDEMRPGLPGMEIDTTIFRPATFIEQSIDNLTRAMLIGIFLVILIIVAFLFTWRTAFISLISIPLSLLAAILVLDIRDATINVMVLAGLVVAIGVVVDDAIIDVENIVRRLRQARAEGSDKSTFRIVLDASVEVRTAITYATVINIVAIVPVFFLEGLSGSFFQPLVLSYGLAVLVSMLVALTVTPALCLLMLSRGKLSDRESPLLRVLKRGYGAILAPIIRRPSPAMLTAAVCLLAGLLIYPTLGNQLLPNFKERDFLMHWLTVPAPPLRRRPASRCGPARTCARSRESATAALTSARRCWATRSTASTSARTGSASAQDVDYDDTLASVHRTVEGYPGSVPRRPDVPARAHQGGPHRDERVHRRTGVRSRSGGAARQVRGDRGADRGHRRRCRRASEPLGGPAPDRGRAGPRCGAALRPEAGRHPPAVVRRSWRARRSVTSSTAARPTTCTCGASRLRATA